MRAVPSLLTKNMRAIYLITFVILLLNPLTVFAQQSTAMGINLSYAGTAHITIEVKNPEKIEELKSILNEPAIKDIYSQRLSAVFGELKNLKLYAETQSFIIEFDSKIAEQKEGKWIVDKKEFQGNIDKISILKVVLPEDAKLVGANPEPDRISENVLIWNNIDFTPEISYEKSSPAAYKILPVAILLVLSAVAFKKLKKRK